LGINKKHKIIIVGAGRIGQALMHFPGFQKEGIIVSAGFDTDPEKIDEQLDVPIYHIKEMPEFIKKHYIKLAILAVPENAAMGCLDMMETSGIKGILNFTSLNLKSDKIAINNVNIGNEIENLIFTITKK
jgi:redox-sensing transcriptional repressor